MNSPLRYHTTRILDAGKVEQVFDVEGHPGLRVVTTLGMNDDGDLEAVDSQYHLADGTVYADAEEALNAWTALGDELVLLDALGAALLRFEHGLIRPLWEHRTAEQKWLWIRRAHSFKQLAESLGITIAGRVAQ